MGAWGAGRPGGRVDSAGQLWGGGRATGDRFGGPPRSGAKSAVVRSFTRFGRVWTGFVQGLPKSTEFGPRWLHVAPTPSNFGRGSLKVGLEIGLSAGTSTSRIQPLLALRPNPEVSPRQAHPGAPCAPRTCLGVVPERKLTKVAWSRRPREFQCPGARLCRAPAKSSSSTCIRSLQSRPHLTPPRRGAVRGRKTDRVRLSPSRDRTQGIGCTFAPRPPRK